MNLEELMKSYALKKMDMLETQDQLRILRQELDELTHTIQGQVGNGTVELYGFRGHWVPSGRNRIDHEAAAIEAGVSPQVIAAYTSNSKPRTSWAKVTKEARVPKKIIEKHTDKAGVHFIIEPVIK